MRIALFATTLIIFTALALFGYLVFLELSARFQRRTIITNFYIDLKKVNDEQSKLDLIANAAVKLSKLKSHFSFNSGVALESQQAWLCKGLKELFEEALKDNKLNTAGKFLNQLETEKCL